MPTPALLVSNRPISLGFSIVILIVIKASKNTSSMSVPLRLASLQPIFALEQVALVQENATQFTCCHRITFLFSRLAEKRNSVVDITFRHANFCEGKTCIGIALVNQSLPVDFGFIRASDSIQ